MNYGTRQILAIKTKDPDAEVPFTNDWASWLPSGQTIVASTWAADAGITIMTGGNAATNTSTTATVWLSGGTAGSEYFVTNRITTSGTPPVKDERTFLVRVIER